MSKTKDNSIEKLRSKKNELIEKIDLILCILERGSECEDKWNNLDKPVVDDTKENKKEIIIIIEKQKTETPIQENRNEDVQTSILREPASTTTEIKQPNELEMVLEESKKDLNLPQPPLAKKNNEVIAPPQPPPPPQTKEKVVKGEKELQLIIEEEPEVEEVIENKDVIKRDTTDFMKPFSSQLKEIVIELEKIVEQTTKPLETGEEKGEKELKLIIEEESDDMKIKTETTDLTGEPTENNKKTEKEIQVEVEAPEVKKDGTEKNDLPEDKSVVLEVVNKDIQTQPSVILEVEADKEGTDVKPENIVEQPIPLPLNIDLQIELEKKAEPKHKSNFVKLLDTANNEVKEDVKNINLSKKATGQPLKEVEFIIEREKTLTDEVADDNLPLSPSTPQSNDLDIVIDGIDKKEIKSQEPSKDKEKEIDVVLDNLTPSSTQPSSEPLSSQTKDIEIVIESENKGQILTPEDENNKPSPLVTPQIKEIVIELENVVKDTIKPLEPKKEKSVVFIIEKGGPSSVPLLQQKETVIDVENNDKPIYVEDIGIYVEDENGNKELEIQVESPENKNDNVPPPLVAPQIKEIVIELEKVIKDTTETLGPTEKKQIVVIVEPSPSPLSQSQSEQPQQDIEVEIKEPASEQTKELEFMIDKFPQPLAPPVTPVVKDSQLKDIVIELEGVVKDEEAKLKQEVIDKKDVVIELSKEPGENPAPEPAQVLLPKDLEIIIDNEHTPTHPDEKEQREVEIVVTKNEEGEPVKGKANKQVIIIIEKNGSIPKPTPPTIQSKDIEIILSTDTKPPREPKDIEIIITTGPTGLSGPTGDNVIITDYDSTGNTMTQYTTKKLNLIKDNSDKYIMNVT